MPFTFNGCGTHYWGWRHREDGTATATCWVVLMYLPVVPLYRTRLRTLTTPQTVQQTHFGGVPVTERHEFQLLERLPLAWPEIRTTLLRTYVYLPALLLIPLGLATGVVVGAFAFGDTLGPSRLYPFGERVYVAHEWFEAAVTIIGIALGVYALAYFASQLMSAARRSHGWCASVADLPEPGPAWLKRFVSRFRNDERGP